MIFEAGLESLRAYRTPIVNSLNVCKNYIFDFREPIINAAVACKEYAIVNFNSIKEYINVLYKFFFD